MLTLPDSPRARLAIGIGIAVLGFAVFWIGGHNALLRILGLIAFCTGVLIVQNRSV